MSHAAAQRALRRSRAGRKSKQGWAYHVGTPSAIVHLNEGILQDMMYTVERADWVGPTFPQTMGWGALEYTTLLIS